MEPEPQISHTETTYTFASPWMLSVAAQKELIAEFNASIQGQKVQIETNKAEPHVFTLQCDEAAFCAFIDTIKNYIRKEKSRETDAFEETKISRVKGTSALDSEREQGLTTGQQGSTAGNLIELENVIREWIPTTPGGRSLIDNNLALIGAIESLASVRIEVSRDKHALVLKSDTAKDVANAIKKLETVESSLNHKTVYHHIAVTEGALSARMRLFPLRELADLIKETLVDQRLPITKSLRNAHVIVLIVDGEVVCRKRNSRAVKGDHPWQSHPLSVAIEGDKATGTGGTMVSKWVEESSSAANVDPFFPIPAPDERKENSLPSQAPPKVSTKRVRIPKGMVNREKKLVEAEDEQPKASSDTLDDSKALQTSSNQLTSTHAEVKPPVIRPPYMPPVMPVPSSDQDPNSAGSKWSHSFVPSGDVGTLLDIDSSPLQGGKAGQKPGRKYQTMNQHKAPVKAGRHALVEGVQNSMQAILERAASSVGVVELRVQIGRLLVDYSTTPTDFHNRSFEMTEWPTLFRAQEAEGIRVEHTNRVTSAYQDVLSVLKIKISGAKPLLNEEPKASKVAFVLQCQLETKEDVEIEMDELGNSEVHGPHRLHGATNLYFVSRIWDARFEVSSREYIFKQNQRQFPQLINSMARTFSAEGPGSVISFSTHSQIFSVQSMFLRRETVYASAVYPDVLLHLTEVQDLNVRQDPSKSERYQGRLQSQSEMISNQRLWWEISVSSQNATRVLQENENSELGEKAKWTPRAVASQEVVSDLFDITEDIVTRIDHVGLRNKGPAADVSSKTTVQRSLRSFDPQAGVSIW